MHGAHAGRRVEKDCHVGHATAAEQPIQQPATRSFSSAAASAEVVIVGSGIMGLNIAYQLRRRDPAMKITVLERASALGFGSSGYSTGFQRAYYSFDETMGPLAWSKSASWQRHRSPRVL